MRLRRGWARFTDQVPRAPRKPTLGAGHLFTFSYLILTTALFGRFHFLFVDEEMKVQGLKSDASSKVEQELKPTWGGTLSAGSLWLPLSVVWAHGPHGLPSAAPFPSSLSLCPLDHCALRPTFPDSGPGASLSVTPPPALWTFVVTQHNIRHHTLIVWLPYGFRPVCSHSATSALSDHYLELDSSRCWRWRDRADMAS